MGRMTQTSVGSEDLALALAAATVNYANVAIMSEEQLYCPTQIMKDKDSISYFWPYFDAPTTNGVGTFAKSTSVGPTNIELDPYFSSMFDGVGTVFFRECDYQIVTTEDKYGSATDLHIDKLSHRDVVERVRVNSHRAPMILTGWGFDLGDRPVPRMGSEAPEVFKFDRETAFNRAKWKSGPLAVAWDDERQVWAGGPQIVCGVVVKDLAGGGSGDIKAPKSPCKPTSFTVKLFRKSSDSDSPPYVNGISTELDSRSRGNDRITVMNRDPSLEQDYMENAMFVIAIRLNYEWLPLWVGCPEDDIKDVEVPCL